MRLRAPAGRDDGIAMITVVLITMVLTSLVVSTVGYTVSSQRLSRRDQDANSALAAAQAGVDDYLFRVSQQPNFEQYSSSNLPPSPNDTPFRSTVWQPVPGSTNGAQFHYDAEYANGVVTLTSTGRLRNAERTVRVLTRRRSFLDYLYFTNYEVLDPLSGRYQSASDAADECDEYWWQNRPSSPCIRISFGGGDQINGPLHTNDTISISGAVNFNGATTTSMDPTRCSPSRRWWATNTTNGCGAASPTFQSGDPRLASLLQMPSTNSELRTDAQTSGCLYNGPTRIVLNSGGTMTVTSDLTVDAAIRTRCVGANKALPGVIYVQNVPSAQSTPACTGLAGNLLGYPIANDITQYDCREGDVFLSGVLNGRLSVAAENNIVVVDDTTYLSYGSSNVTDMLGLIANGFVQVYHPVSCPAGDRDNNEGIVVCNDQRGANLSDPRTSRGVFTNARIHAAVLALNHSFIVQNYNNGNQLGGLTVYGAIGQAWRGTVALGGATGYVKDYNYDGRLKYEGPPNFIDPLESPWQVQSFADIPNPRRCTSTITTRCVPP